MNTLRRLIALAGAACVLGACAQTERAQPIVTDDASVGAIGALPMASETSNGMEVRWWYADDTSGAVGLALASAEGVGEDVLGGASSRLASNGIRVVRVPIGEALSVSERIGRLGARKRTWFGANGVWSEAYLGRRVAGNVPVTLDGERVRLERGTLRVLARVWAARTLGGAVLRADFATQLREPGRSPGETYFERPEFKGEIDKGEVLGGLSFSAVLDPEYAYVITCAPPGTVWQTGEASGGSSQGGEVELPEALPGPPTKAALTAGEVLFSAQPEETGGELIRSVVMVIPRLPSVGRALR